MKKVLVVDDDPDILDAIQMILLSSGFDPVTTTNGEEVYQKINEHKPDVIILDVLLSGHDGRAICRNLKTDMQTENIPVLMISAHPSAKDSVKACGAEAFLAKPFSIGDLIKDINKLSHSAEN
jgi:DNA-binding response OmpR family regulator